MASPAWLIPAITSFGQLGGAIGGGIAQGHMNLKMAEYQNAKNLEFWRMNNDYNSPLAQMERFKQAGLNPHLMYGQGSPGLASAPQASKPDSVNVQQPMTELIPRILQARLLQSQIDLTNTKVDESGVKQDLMNAQANLAKANPFMKTEYINAMVLQLESTARMKAQEASFLLDNQVSRKGSSSYSELFEGRSLGLQKMAREMDLLEQRFNLGASDQKVKAQILESKEFENALKEIQVNWMKDADITPQHIYQGILLLLTKLMR